MSFGVLTGDIVVTGTNKDWDEVDSVLKELDVPVYFAVGNHDVKNRKLFEERYGKTYFSFVFQNDLHIILDPNLDNWNISNGQLVFLVKTLIDYLPDTGNIFIYFHQLLWWEKDNRYAHVRMNSKSGRDDKINFWTEIEPLFHNLKNKVTMFAGDIGAASWSDDFMFDNYDNITFIASGMGEGIGDNFIITTVWDNGEVDYKLIAIDGDDIHALGRLEDYNLP